MIGKKLAHYEITAKLGQGGMGEVYRARDTKLGREVAIKLLPAEFAKDEERLARFGREARTLASLHHPNIASIFGFEEDTDQRFLVMELVEGLDLDKRLQSGAIGVAETIDIGAQIAQGLDEAHEKGIVHRDLKPANVKLGQDGKVKILDFGLARAYLGESGSEGDPAYSPTITAAMTQVGTILGTAAYMSPEQARGKPIDRRADIWAFGAILWEMLTGSRLFAGETISDTLASVLKTDPDWDDLPKATPHGLRRLLERCLERDARKRLRDIGEARIRLQKWRDDPATLDESFGFVEPVAVAPETRSKSWIPWTVAVLATAAALFLGLRGDGGDRHSETRPITLEIRLEDDEHMTTGGYATLSPSPDGEYLLWSTSAGLHLRHRASEETRLIPNTVNLMAAGFSPDSRWVAAAHSGKLYRISVTGGSPIDICESPSSRGIAWVDDETIVLTPDYASALQVVSVTDGSVRELTQLRAGERSHRWPSPLPGGKAVLFMTQFSGRAYQDSDIEMVSLEDGSRRTLYRGGANPRYAPTGHLLFARSGAILAIAFDPSAGTVSGLATPVLDGVLARVGDQELDDGSVQYGFDQDGTLIYRSAQSNVEQRSRMAWLDMATKSIEPFGDAGQYESPIISPNGQRIAMRRGLGAASRLLVHDLASGAERLVSDAGGMKYLGAWAPDNQTLYWTQADADGRSFELVRANIESSRDPEVVLRHNHSCFVNEISSDGRWLFLTYWDPEQNYEIGMVDLTADEPTLEPYAVGDDGQTGARLSPDGQFVIYDDSVTERGNLSLRRFPDTGARWRIGEPDLNYDEYHWTVDGDILARNEAGLFLFPMSVEAGTVTVGRSEMFIQYTGLFRFDGGDLDIHPDGRRMLILQPAEGIGEAEVPRILLRTGWFEELQRQVAGD